MQKKILLIPVFILSVLLAACGAKSDSKSNEKKGPKPTLVTVTQVNKQGLEITEQAIGTLEGLIDPTIAAEVAARVIKVHVIPGQAVKAGQLIATLDASDFSMQRQEAQAEVARIEALLENQSKTVTRNQALVDKKFISQNAVDNDLAQKTALKQQLEGAKARIGSINHSSNKARVLAPVDGVIQKKLVDTGDYVHIGDPIVQIISNRRLLAHLPFPENIAAQFKPGLKVRLTTPSSSKVYETTIHELKPMITAENRSIDVVAEVVDEAGWQPGASVTGTVVLGQQAAAMMVPEQSVVIRPAGDVVYKVRDGRAYQAIVKIGLRKDNMVELLDGVKPDDTIVVDGAGFLTDNTPVKVQEDNSNK